jgi:hypothetical protein
MKSIVAMTSQDIESSAHGFLPNRNVILNMIVSAEVLPGTVKNVPAVLRDRNVIPLPQDKFVLIVLLDRFVLSFLQEKNVLQLQEDKFVLIVLAEKCV